MSGPKHISAVVADVVRKQANPAQWRNLVGAVAHVLPEIETADIEYLKQIIDSTLEVRAAQSRLKEALRGCPGVSGSQILYNKLRSGE